ncbi:hypothetical protein D3C75_1265590 [compost metagenome]
MCGVPLGNALDAGHGFTASLAYFFDDCLGSAAAIRGAAQIIDYHTGAFTCSQFSDFRANTAPGTCDDDHLTFQKLRHLKTPLSVD